MSDIGDQIIASLEEALADANGERKTLRHHVVMVPKAVDVKAIRTRLGMSQGQFAHAFGFHLEALKDWEFGRSEPEGAARVLLTVIDRRPDAVLEALAG